MAKLSLSNTPYAKVLAGGDLYLLFFKDKGLDKIIMYEGGRSTVGTEVKVEELCDVARNAIEDYVLSHFV